MKKLLLLLCTLCVNVSLCAQADSDPDQPAKALRKEKVDGFLPVMGYLGGKLLDELSDRLNLDNNEAETAQTEVQVELGPFKFKRIEERPLK